MNKTVKITAMAARALSALLCAAVFAGAVSCKKSEESYLGTLSVKVTAPDGQTVNFEELQVSFTNTSDETTATVNADASGEVSFVDLVAGTYNVSAWVRGANAGTTYSAVQNNVVVESRKTTTVELKLQVVNSSPDLVIKEVFYSGTSMDYDELGSSMMKDSFVEIFNNSAYPVSLAGLYIGEAWSPSKVDTDVTVEKSVLEDGTLDHNYIYLNLLAQIPTDYDLTLAPGKSFVLAMNAINFNKELRDALTLYEMPVDEEKLSHVIDLSGADMETYTVDWWNAQGGDPTYAEMFDLDNPDVPNIDIVYVSTSKQAFFWNMNGGTPVIFRREAAFGKSDMITYKYVSNGLETEETLVKVPVNIIIDGVDCVGTVSSSKWKCLPDAIDKGYSYVPGGDNVLTNYSVRRKIDENASRSAGRLVLEDTNNSSADFEAMDPPAPKGGYTGYDLK